LPNASDTSWPSASMGALLPLASCIVSERRVQRPSSCLRTPSIVPAPSSTGFVGSGLGRGAPAQGPVIIVRHTLKSHRVVRYLIRERVTAHLPPSIPPGATSTMLRDGMD